MEADGIVDGFLKSVEMHGLKYNRLIGKCTLFIYILRFFLISNLKYVNNNYKKCIIYT